MRAARVPSEAAWPLPPWCGRYFFQRSGIKNHPLHNQKGGDGSLSSSAGRVSALPADRLESYRGKKPPDYLFFRIFLAITSLMISLVPSYIWVILASRM